NVPHNGRFKPENVIFVGLMPDPKEPKTNKINNHIEPIVDELIQLYHGIRMPTIEFPVGEVIRAALMMVACDIPAVRNTSGFTTLNSSCASFKRNRHFTRLDSTNKVDFRGFKESEWCRRSCEYNRLHAEEWKNGVTLSERQHLGIENGVRWSQLHRLGYFDLVRGTIIDPAHSLLL
ncbi:hypothetical protein PHYBLDRAFT_102311, partial [Phycomyces blakesleeanus NRRL 1555(-)]